MDGGATEKAMTRPQLAGFDPFDQAYYRDPYALTSRAQAESPVFYHEPLDYWVVTRFEDAVAVLSDWRTFSSRAYRAMPVPPELRDRVPAEQQRIPAGIIAENFVNIDPPVHTVARKRAQQTFTRTLIARSEGMVREQAHELIDGFEAAGRCDLMQDFAYKLALRVIVRIIGLPTEAMPQFRTWIDDFFSLMAPASADDGAQPEVTLPIGEIEDRYARTAEAHAFFTRFLDDRRRAPREDLATAMVRARTADGSPAMDDTQIIAHLFEITAAGADTTANLIGHMVRYLTLDPAAREEIMGDPSLWQNAIEEGLRLTGVASQAFRITTREVELGGVRIPAGAKLAVHLLAADTDGGRYPDPLRFDIHRPDAADHLAFGSGRHFCMGAPLARLEASVALQALYARLPSIRVDLDQPLEFVPAITLRGLRHLPASWPAQSI